MAADKQVKFREIPWSEHAHKDLSEIEGASAFLMEEFRKGSEAGIYTVIAVDWDGARVGTLIFETVSEPLAGSVAIMHGLRCEAVAGVSLTNLVRVAFGRAVRKTGIKVWRCYTRREGLAEKMRRAGASVQYEIEVTA